MAGSRVNGAGAADDCAGDVLAMEKLAVRGEESPEAAWPPDMIPGNVGDANGGVDTTGKLKVAGAGGAQ
jgi:hypothetical protein